jgi:cell wall-associated NlpC family hydrolase
MTAVAVSGAHVVAAARGWLGTPFQHQQRAKGLAVDCAGLIIGVARELGLVAPDFDVTHYPRQPDGVSLLRWCEEYMVRIGQTAIQPGDVVVVAFDSRPQHLGIVADYRHGGLSMIHAYEHAMVHRVVEHRLMFSASMRFCAAYRLHGVG